MTILTDEMIEIAARAIIRCLQDQNADRETVLDERRWEDFAPDARAALTAALPSIIEACAKEIEKPIPYGMEPFNGIRQKCADRIRSLSHSIKEK